MSSPPIPPAPAAAPAPNPRSRAAAVHGYLLLALVGAATLVLSREGPTALILCGAATSAACLHGFLALNPRWVALEMIVLAAVGYLTLPEAPVHWLLGSASGGGVAALLTLAKAREDHHFFLPAFATAGVTALLFVLGQGANWTESIDILNRYIAEYSEAMRMTAEAVGLDEAIREAQGEATWERWGPRVGLVAVCALIALWMVVLWFFHRFARRRLGLIGGFLHSLVLFRVGHIYTFLLIGALVFEILSVWLGEEGFRKVSYPLFAVCGVGFLMVYLGVVLFFVAFVQASVPRSSPPGMRLAIMAGVAVAAALAMVTALQVGPLIGLADVWIDFRKIGLIEDKLTPS